MTANESKKIIQRTFQGEVVADKNDKTIVVVVKTTQIHPKYFKRYLVSKKYQVHDPKNQYQVGDLVTFVASRPISKNKKWRALYR